MGESIRSLELESRLEFALKNNHRVWILGDVHGHRSSLENLLDKLELTENDEVLILGDIVDRGPDSAGVIRRIIQQENLHSLMGNHEQMMLKAVRDKDPIMRIAWKNYAWGGSETLSSFERNPVSADEIDFLSQLPTEIILDSYRLVHGGYDPQRSIDAQTDEIRLKTRLLFKSEIILDESRQIFVGHTPVQELENVSSDGVWRSKNLLADGRPSVIALDGGIHKHRQISPRLMAMELQSRRVVIQERLESGRGD